MLHQKRKRGRAAVAEAAESLSTYGKRLVDDEKMRRRVIAAVGAAAAARRRARRTGVSGTVWNTAHRVASDHVLRTQFNEAVGQLQKASWLGRKKESHRARNAALFVAGAGMVALALPSVRRRVLGLVGGGSSDDDFDFSSPPPTAPAVDVPPTEAPVQ
jgi:hypothetical protein